MLVQHSFGIISPAVCRADIIQLHLRQYGCAQQLDRHRRFRQRNRDRRKDQVSQKACDTRRIGHIPARCKQMQHKTKQKRDQDARKERWNRHDHLIDDQDDTIYLSTRVMRAEQTDRNRNCHHNQKGHRRKRQRDRNLFGDHAAHRHLILVGGSEISLYKIDRPAAKAHQERFI